MATAFVNCDIYTGEEILTERAVIVDEGRIVDLPAHVSVPGDAEIVDLEGRSVVPGFIDLQVNGGGDVLFNENPTLDAIRHIGSSHRKFGVTHWLPTFITGPRDGMVAAWRAVQKARELGNLGVLGIHFEGPYLSPVRAGVHDSSLMAGTVDPEIMDLLVADPSGIGVCLMTIAAEVVSVDEIRQLCKSGTRVAIGHSNANAAQAKAAIDAGADLATHFFNAMSPLTAREPGVVGVFLANDDVHIDIIADGHHVDFTCVRAALNAKSPGKAFLVTDAMPPVGGSGSDYTLGPYEIQVLDDRCVTADGVLAGSALDMATAVRNLVQKVGVPKDEALRMASLYPAEYLNIADQLGRVAPGYSADLAVIDNEIRVSAVISTGLYFKV